MSQRAWTMPEINRMAQMVADGLTRKQIATRLNRTVASVSRRAVKLGLASQSRRQLPAPMGVISAEYSNGHGGAKRAAAILGMSHCAVRKMASRYGVAKCQSE